MVNKQNCGVADTDPEWHCLPHSGKTQYSINCRTVAKMWEKKATTECWIFCTCCQCMLKY